MDGTDKTCTPEWTPAVNFEFEQRVIELVNAERGAAGLPPLKSSPALTQTARYHAADMGIDDYFSHDSKDRLDEELLTICSYQTRIGNAYTGGQWIGENIAEGYHSPEGVVAAWMASEVHRDNILNERFWEIGAGYYRSAMAGNREYWALDLGKRFNRFPLVINAEATFTDSPKVILYVYGDWKEMRLRNDSGSWTKWQPFLNSIKWQIPSEPGEHEVIVELRSGSLRSSSSDMIRLAGENSQK